MEITVAFNRSLQIFIIADNFVFRSTNLEGGFAIIDSIEYYADLCTDSNNMMPLKTKLHDYERIESQNDVTATATDDYTSSAAVALVSPSNKISKLIELNSVITPESNDHAKLQKYTNYRNRFIEQVQRPHDYAALCSALQCSFENEPCVKYILQSSWNISTQPIGTIRGDASSFPFNPGISEGSFAYAVGPSKRTRFQTPPFEAETNFYLIFSYYKTSNQNHFRVLIKQAHQHFERVIFTV
ncbi:unnamed protein product [Anisakis simplex]|uniref:Uncharacterized protein n=1 Tax=Anisakis simplex TaxID=6269 RepID=A0A0M3K196_ANISI|nr:unnamed protein product [Anisakis simplex]